MPRFEDLLVCLHDFFVLCDSLELGAGARRSRFGIYKNRMVELQAEFNKVDDGEDPVPIYRSLQARLPGLLVALAESSEIRSLFPFLSASEPAIRSKVSAILRGPELPSDENTSSNQARNIQFELWLASLITQAGISVELAEPDLRCQVGDLTVLIACKRLFSPFKLQKRSNEAVEQLSRSMKALSSQNAGGLVAISLSRILGTSESATHIGNRTQGMDLLEKRIDRFIESRTTTWQATREAQGIIFHLTSMTRSSASILRQ